LSLGARLKARKSTILEQGEEKRSYIMDLERVKCKLETTPIDLELDRYYVIDGKCGW
jgi:hypothetical protein